MKKVAVCLLFVFLITTLSACGDSQPQAMPETSSQETSAGVSDNSDTVQDNIPASTVYFTSDITPEGLMALYEALGWEPTGNVAVKLSTGEPPASNYLDPELIKDLVQSVDATIVECNTAYGGSRTETAMHMQVAEDHGFTAIAMWIFWIRTDRWKFLWRAVRGWKAIW